MSTYTLLQGAAIGGYLFILGLVYGRWRLNPVHRAFLLFLWFGLGWAAVTFFCSTSLSTGNEMLAKRIGAVFWIPLNFWVLRFSYILLERKYDATYYVLGAFTLSSLGIYLGTDLALAGFTHYDWGIAALRGPLHLPISLLSATCAILALGNLALGWYRAPTSPQRRPLAVMTIGSTITLIAAYTANLVLPVFFSFQGFPELGSYAVFIISPFLYFAVVRYDFLRIDVPHVAQELFENAKDGILLVDGTGVVRHANQSARHMLAEDISGRPLDQVLPAQRMTQDGCEQFQLDRDERFIVEVARNTKVRRDEGEVIILRDVTTQRKAEEVLRSSRDALRKEVEERTQELEHAQKMEAIGTIAGGVAHDFNNILAAIVGFATASKADLPEGHRVQGDLDDILLAANRGRSIVRQLMTITRRHPAHRLVVDGSRCVAEAVKLLGVSVPRNVSVHFTPLSSAAVRVDPSRLSQVLLNLAANAFQAMTNRGGTLKIEVDVMEFAEDRLVGEQRLPQGKYLQIMVQDNGPGMLPEVASRAFDPFFTTKSADEGTGLGLATARRIIKEHGGAIGLETAPGQGCTLHIWLPCVEGELSKEVIEDMNIPGGKERLMLVDDAEQVVRAVSRMLEPLGYRVRAFSDPEIALRAFRDAPAEVDLVITDLAMPRLNGAELAQAMLEIRPRLPILVITGHENPNSYGLSESVGVRSVLFKPLDRRALAIAVRHGIDTDSAGEHLLH